MPDMPKICPQCAHGQAEGDFCEVCGTRLQAAAQAAPPVQPAYSHPAPAAPPPAGAAAAYPPPVAPPAGTGTPPPRPQYTPGYYPPQAYQAPVAERGFFARLFDFSFESFITPTIIRILFIIYIVAVGLGALIAVIAAFTQSTLYGILTLLVLAPIGAFLYILMGRVWLEIIIILFRIHDNTEQMALAAKRQG